jgi:hypothetical protein
LDNYRRRTTYYQAEARQGKPIHIQTPPLSHAMRDMGSTMVPSSNGPPRITTFPPKRAQSIGDNTANFHY